MTTTRLGTYTSFFSERISKTSTTVSQLFIGKNNGQIQASLLSNYAKCENNLKKLMATNAVNAMKADLNECKQAMSNGYEKIKVGLNEIIESEVIQNGAISVKDNAKRCYEIAAIGTHKVKGSVTRTIGAENLDKMNEHCQEYKKSCWDNYNTAKKNLTNLMGSEEITRVKNIFEDSMNAVLSSNLLFDLGLMLIPSTSSYYVALQCSKYLIAGLIFAISSCKSYDENKSNHILEESIEEYQHRLDLAYDVTEKLQAVFARIEVLLHGEHSNSLYVSSKDFETKHHDMNCQVSTDELYNARVNMFIRSILNGISKSMWPEHIIRILALLLPATRSINILCIIPVLIYGVLSELRDEQIRAENEDELNLLMKEMAPISETFQHLSQKLNLSTHSLQNVENKVSSPTHIKSETFDLYAITKQIAKISGLYFLLNEVFKIHKGMNLMVCLAALQFTLYDFYWGQHHQQNLNTSADALDPKMKDLVNMTEKLRKLLLKQENYESFLIESQKAKEEYRKAIDIIKSEQRRKAEEERAQRVLEEKEALERKRLEDERLVELKKIEEIQEEIKKIEEAFKQELIQLNETYLQYVSDHTRRAKFHSNEEKIVNEPPMINESRQPERHVITSIPTLQGLEVLNSVKDFHEAKKMKSDKSLLSLSVPIILSGFIGAGIGWLLALSMCALLAVPTLGFSLIPAISAVVGAVISGGLAYLRCHSITKTTSKISENFNNTTTSSSSIKMYNPDKNYGLFCNKHDSLLLNPGLFICPEILRRGRLI